MKTAQGWSAAPLSFWVSHGEEMVAFGLSDLSGSLGQAMVCVSPHARGDRFGWVTRHVTGASCKSKAARLQRPGRQVSHMATCSSHSSLSGEVTGGEGGLLRMEREDRGQERLLSAGGGTRQPRTAPNRSVGLGGPQPTVGKATQPERRSAPRRVARSPGSTGPSLCPHGQVHLDGWKLVGVVAALTPNLRKLSSKSA